MTIRTICFPYLFLSGRKTENGTHSAHTLSESIKVWYNMADTKKKREFASSDSILLPGCPKLYDWNDEDLSEQGRWIRDWFLSETD